MLPICKQTHINLKKKKHLAAKHNENIIRHQQVKARELFLSDQTHIYIFVHTKSHIHLFICIHTIH